MGEDEMTPAGTGATQQKAALRATLDGNRLPIKAVADAVDVSYQALCAWADVSVDSHIPSRRIPGVLAASDHPALVDYWAGLMGRVTVALPRAAASQADVCQIADVAGAFAALLAAHVDAAADGKWTAKEFADLDRIGTQLATRVLGEVEYIRRQVQA